GDTPHHNGVPLEGEQFLARARLPDLHHVVTASGGQAPAVRTEGDTCNRTLVSFEHPKMLTRCRLQDFHFALAAGGGEAPAVRSSPPDASRRPSGLWAILRIMPRCPWRVNKSLLVATSQTLTRASRAPEASCCPSGLKQAQ